MGLFDFVYDWLSDFLPPWAQNALLVLLVVGVAGIFGLGWYLSNH